MNPDRKLFIGVAVALLLALAAGFGIARLTTPKPPAEETAEKAASDEVEITSQGIAASGIVVAPASDAPVAGIVMASATVEAIPEAEAVLTARAPGTVTRIYKRIGDAVNAGETVALVESREGAAIAAQRTSADARAALASRQLERERGLFEQGVSPRADFEAAEANLSVAQAEARQAEAGAKAAGVTEDGRTVAVVSSIAGRITVATANLGSYVQAEKELFRVADPTRTQIEASLPPADAARVKENDRVELTTNDGQNIEGRVRSATGVVDPQTRQATLVITPSDTSKVLAPGQLVQARVFSTGGTSGAGVSVPQDAVQTVGTRTVVFLRTGKGFKAQAVQIGGRSGGMVGVASGLTAGTPIATTNAFLLKAELEKESAE